MQNEKTRIAVLVSGGGTNLQAILDACQNGTITHGSVEVVISSQPNAYALTRAKNYGIDAFTVSKKQYPYQVEFENAIENILNEKNIELIVLAGFMSILSADFTKKHENRILNVHPSLIPSFCGKGFYGLRVHQAALNYGVKVTGATVHFVNEIPDGGKIILQKAVEIQPGDTPQTLQRRVMEEAEWIILPKAVELVSSEIFFNKSGDTK